MTLTSTQKDIVEPVPGSTKAQLFGDISNLLTFYGPQDDNNKTIIPDEEAILYIEHFKTLNVLEEVIDFTKAIFADYGLDYKPQNLPKLPTIISDEILNNRSTLQALQLKRQSIVNQNYEAVFNLHNSTSTTHKSICMIRKDLTQLKQKYLSSEDKFGFFSQHSDREKTLNKCIHNIENIFSTSPVLNKQQYVAILKELSRAIVETKISHEENSFAGLIGLTESRLAKQLTDYANKIMDEFDITAGDIDEYIAQSKQARMG